MATDDEATEALTLDVDTMILDYLVCKATRAAISERMAEATKAPSESCEPYLEMVNGEWHPVNPLTLCSAELDLSVSTAIRVPPWQRECSGSPGSEASNTHFYQLVLPAT
jgi:hypothetical protein